MLSCVYVCMRACSRLRLKKVKVILAILDCCREFHHEKLVGSTRGVGHLAVGSECFGGTIIAYACGPSGYAMDGEGEYGRMNVLHTDIYIE